MNFNGGGVVSIAIVGAVNALDILGDDGADFGAVGRGAFFIQ